MGEQSSFRDNKMTLEITQFRHSYETVNSNHDVNLMVLLDVININR